VAWYWLLDPQLRSLEILQLAPQGRYLHVLGASAGILEKIPGCEGLTSISTRSGQRSTLLSNGVRNNSQAGQFRAWNS
jgi:hypothetical protein